MTPSPFAAAAGIDALKERKREIDDVWLLTIVVVLLSIGVLWFQRILDIDLARVAWVLFAYGSAYLAMAFAADRASTARTFVVTVALVQAAGIVTLTMLWRLTGGLQNPMFLLVFTLPVMAGSVILPRWQAYATAGLAVLAVTVVALADSAALRWYLWQTGLPVRAALNVIGQIPATSTHPFPATAESPPYLMVVVFLFGVLMFAAAAVADAIGQAVAKVQARSAAATDALARAENLSAEAFLASPWPTALVYADTFRVAQANREFLQQFFLDPEAPGRSRFFELVRFTYPEAVEALIQGAGGEVPLAVLTVDREQRLARVRVSTFTHDGTRYASVSVQDITAAHHLRLALDALDQPVVLVAGDRVLACNASAEAAVPDLQPGVDAGAALAAANLPFAWWRLGVRSRQECQVRLADRTFRAVCRAAAIPGEREPLAVIALEEKRGEA